MKISTEKDAILEAARLTLEIDRLKSLNVDLLGALILSRSILSSFAAAFGKDRLNCPEIDAVINKAKAEIEQRQPMDETNYG